jgi:hypothetical protein
VRINKIAQQLRTLGDDIDEPGGVQVPDGAPQALPPNRHVDRDSP